MRNPIRLKNFNARYAPYFLAGAVLLLASDASWRGIAIGSLPIVAGLGLRAWGTGHLVKNERFTVSGPYAYVRHPLYLGTILVAFGFALMLGGWATVAVLAFVLPWFALSYFPRKERVESARLQARYGSAFDHYRAEVPALWPRLRAWRPAPAESADVDSDIGWSIARYDRNNELGTLIAVLAGIAAVALRASLA
jgi:protein-S-isoprenylcysteine O-methyltransferase Ste14